MKEAVKTVESHVYSLKNYFLRSILLIFISVSTIGSVSMSKIGNDISTEFLKHWKAGDTYDAVIDDYNEFLKHNGIKNSEPRSKNCY